MTSTTMELIRTNYELCEKGEESIGEILDMRPNGVSYLRNTSLDEFLIYILIAKIPCSAAA
jgi:hypothetical protein